MEFIEAPTSNHFRQPIVPVVETVALGSRLPAQPAGAEVNRELCRRCNQPVRSTGQFLIANYVGILESILLNNERFGRAVATGE